MAGERLAPGRSLGLPRALLSPPVPGLVAVTVLPGCASTSQHTQHQTPSAALGTRGTPNPVRGKKDGTRCHRAAPREPSGSPTEQQRGRIQPRDARGTLGFRYFKQMSNASAYVLAGL